MGTGPLLELFELQRRAGNRAVSERLQAGWAARVDRGPALTVGAAHDQSEQEADLIMAAMPSERSAASPAVRAVGEPRAAMAAPTPSAEAPAEVERAVVRLDAGRQVPAAVRAAAEARLGRDLGDVRVHVDARAAEALHASAFTLGRDIVFGAGQYAPDTVHGQRLLAHELTHVVQQEQARPAAAPTIQRQARTPLEEVQAVTSLSVEENLRGAVSGDEAALQRKLAARRKAIAAALKQVKEPKLRDQAWAKRKAEALEKDLAKSQDEILSGPDSPSVNKALRDDIVKAHKALVAGRTALSEGEKKWHRYDDLFASDAVVKTLAAKGFSPADLKALVAQESMDLLIAETKGDIAGIAQMGAKEAKEVGGDPKDRLDPKTAIPLAAKVLVKKAQQLDAMLTKKPAGDDYKKFVFASYNAGASTIATAQKKAPAMKRDATSWDQLVAGGDTSPLFAAIQERLKDLPTRKKYRETTDYVDRIFKRLH
jgi:membrane-bound lytic murein transglycosylase MltF